MPAWSPDGRSIVYTTWTTRGGHIKRVPAGGGARRDAQPRTRAITSTRLSRPMAARVVFLSGAVSDQLYSILLDTPPDGDAIASRTRSARSAASTRPTRSRSAGCRPPAALRRSSPRRRAAARPHFAQRRFVAHLPDDARGLQSITIGRLRPAHAAARDRAPDRATTRRQPTRFACRPTAHARSSACRASITSSRCRGPAAKRSRCASRVAASTRGAGQAAVAGGRRLPRGGARDGKQVTWAWGAQFFRQAVGGRHEPQQPDVVVEAPRGEADGIGAAHRRARHHHEGRRGDRTRRRPRHRQPHRGGRGRGIASARRPARAPSTSRGKTIMPGFVDAHAHMWAPRGLHQTEVWQYLANLAYGVTTTRDPQTSTPDVFAYADMVDAGMMPGPRVYATGPGVFVSSGIEDRDSGVPLHQALQGRVSHQHHQAVRGRRPDRAAVDDRSRARNTASRPRSRARSI